MFDDNQGEPRTAGSRKREGLNEAHREVPGEPVQPEAGHPVPAR